MLGRAPLCLAAVMTLALVTPVAAQRAESARVVHRPSLAMGSVQFVPARAGSLPFVPAEGEAKSPVAAGLLSLVIPGVGSFYAGHSTHGFVHLGVHMGAALISVASCGQGKDSPCGGASDAAILVALVNWPWSIVTAVRDARASGDGASRRSQK